MGFFYSRGWPVLTFDSGAKATQVKTPVARTRKVAYFDMSETEFSARVIASPRLRIEGWQIEVFIL